MANWNAYNPFGRRESHSPGALVAHKMLTLVSWVLAMAVSVYYTTHDPRDGHGPRHRIWDQNYLHPSAFTMNHVIGDVYWIVLFLLQLGYVLHLYSRDAAVVSAAASVGSHFILNNLLHFAFVMLFVRSHFVWAELVLILNFINLSSLYFLHNTHPRFIHGPTVSWPLAWTFVAIYWNGAIMVPHHQSLVARVFGNVFIWSIFTYGSFFLIAYKDYTMGFALCVLTAAIGVAQLTHHIIALQWIFAFIIMSLLFLMTVASTLPFWNNITWRRQAPAAADQERAPLLNE